MVIERYTRKYVEDEVHGWSGYRICNDDFDGDAELPSFMPEPELLGDVEKIFAGVEIDFGLINEGPFYDYIMESMKKLFTGQESDWRIVAIDFDKGLLKLNIVNSKLIKIENLIHSLDVKNNSDIVSVSFHDMPPGIIDFWLYLPERGPLSLKFSHEREDLGDEVDYYDISVDEKRTHIEEYHKISRACRGVELSFSDETDENGRYIMFGEIEEMR